MFDVGMFTELIKEISTSVERVRKVRIRLLYGEWRYTILAG